jgi:hypothetical protein
VRFNKNETNNSDNSALDKINRQVAVEASCLSRPAGARLLCVFARRASQASDADADANTNTNTDFDTGPNANTIANPNANTIANPNASRRRPRQWQQRRRERGRA